MASARPLVVDMNRIGHRGPGVDVLARLLDADAAFADEPGALDVAVRHPGLLVWQTADLAPLVFARIAMRRALRGRRTVGIMFRTEAVRRASTLRARAARGFYALVRALPGVRTLAIQPALRPLQADALVDDVIPDVQFWDLALLPRADAGGFADPIEQSIREVAGGRRVLVALGFQTLEKGFDYFVDVWRSDPALRERWLFASVGRVLPPMERAADALRAAGGFVHDAAVDESTLLRLYGAAAAVWCCYNPVYDQSSGILGRAFQLGAPVFVRKTSVLHDDANPLTCALPWGLPEAAAAIVRDDVRAHAVRADVAAMAGLVRERILAGSR